MGTHSIVDFCFGFFRNGVLLNDFYALPAPIAVLVGLFAAFIALKGGTQQKLLPSFRGVERAES